MWYNVIKSHGGLANGVPALFCRKTNPFDILDLKNCVSHVSQPAVFWTSATIQLSKLCSLQGQFCYCFLCLPWSLSSSEIPCTDRLSFVSLFQVGGEKYNCEILMFSVLSFSQHPPPSALLQTSSTGLPPSEERRVIQKRKRKALARTNCLFRVHSCTVTWRELTPWTFSHIKAIKWLGVSQDKATLSQEIKSYNCITAWSHFYIHTNSCVYCGVWLANALRSLSLSCPSLSQSVGAPNSPHKPPLPLSNRPLIGIQALLSDCHPFLAAE